MVAMKNLRYVIGIDIGTTSTKPFCLPKKAIQSVTHAVEYPLYASTPGAAEQPSRNLLSSYQSRKESMIAVVLTRYKYCLSFSAAMHSLIAVNAEGKALTRSITWADNRSAKWAEKIKQEQHGHEIY
jgi:gluconokinase